MEYIVKKGFFIVVKNSRIPFKMRREGQSPQVLRVSLLEPVAQWEEQKAHTLDDAIAKIRDYYNARKAAGEVVPPLVSPDEGPKADGRTIRFIPVDPS